MTHWRMQLHPSKPEAAIEHCVKSLTTGYIGLDFTVDIGDLTTTSRNDVPENQRDYLAFADEMKPGDHVLIIAHHFPFALVTVDGPYNFIRKPIPELGVWFQHLRKVKNIRYYADFITNAHAWERIIMTDTISPLRDQNSKSYQLIENWKV
jgi:hypothetical protein